VLQHSFPWNNLAGDSASFHYPRDPAHMTHSGFDAMSKARPLTEQAPHSGKSLRESIKEKSRKEKRGLDYSAVS
jgi:hypothetical protein